MMKDYVDLTRQMIHHMVQKGYLLPTGMCGEAISYALGEEPPKADTATYAIWHIMKSME
jgi:phosphopantothenate synthetase